MKVSYTYVPEKGLNRVPYVSLFLQEYNDKYSGVNSYACKNRLKEENLTNQNLLEILIFYHTKTVEAETIKLQVQETHQRIKTTFKKLLSTSKLEKIVKQY